MVSDSYHELCITNTFFGTKPHHRVSWRHPRSKHWHQLDLILMRQMHLKNFLVTRTYHSTDCDTDHSLVCCRVKLQPKMFPHTKQKGKTRIDVSKTQHPDHLAKFKTLLSSTFVGDYNQPSSDQWEMWRILPSLLHLVPLGRGKDPNRMIGTIPSLHDLTLSLNPSVLICKHTRTSHLQNHSTP